MKILGASQYLPIKIEESFSGNHFEYESDRLFYFRI